MSTTKRVTIHFESGLHRAVRLESARSGRTISEIVSDAVRAALGEDAEDLGSIEDRASEPVGPFASFVMRLRRRGRP